MKKNINVSIIIPAYDCSDVIKKLTQDVISSFEDAKFDYELIVVIDGQDDNILAEVKSIKSDRLQVLHYERNRGKGFAVKLGMQVATGDYIGYIDGGSDINIESLVKGINIIIDTNVDIVCGSKKHPDSKVTKYSLPRKVYTFGYNSLARILLGIDFQDTQVGLKIYSKELVRRVIPVLLVKRFAFEVEMLAVARLFGFSTHKDIPVSVVFQDRSSAARSVEIMRMFVDTLAVFYRLRILRYYQRKDKIKSTKLSQELLNIRFL